MDRLLAFTQLMRLDKPVGALLLLWPTLAALWIAADGDPPLLIVSAFVVGTFVMRATGCVINDIADRNYDRHVQRTENRPLTQGRVSLTEAYALFVILALIGLAIVMTLNRMTQLLAVLGVAITVAYPYLKRWTHLPQVVLGIAFSWGIPMAFTAAGQSLPGIAWLMFTASLLWIIAYDTEYAMVDRRDDLEIGIKSTAILFGRIDRFMIGALQLSALILFLLVGLNAGFRHIYYVAIVIIAALFISQQYLIKNREEQACLAAFRNNTWVGLSLFLGTVTEYAILDVLAPQ
jgi:4-hydroxybenzoate polyprenyltransferase